MPAPAYAEMEAYIRQQAAARGIDPNVAVRVAQSEALNVFDPTKPDLGGDDRSSFGLYQLHYGGLSKAMPNPGLGDEFTAVTGLDARDPSTWKQQVNFSLDHAAKNGWKAWRGAKNTGIGDYEGISGASRRVSGPVEAAGGGAGADVGASPLYNAPTVASAFVGLGDPNAEPPAAAPYEARRTLGDDFAASVSGDTRRRSSEGGIGVTYGAADQEPSSSSAFDFGSPAAPEDGQAPSALAQPSEQSLADLFTVKDIGQAALADPRTGASLIRRQRRAYG